MKRKQLIKQSRDIPEELILRHLEYSNYRLSDYFLVGEVGQYERGIWLPNGKPSVLMFMSEDEVMDFAIEQFLVSHVPVYKTEAEIPTREPVRVTA